MSDTWKSLGSITSRIVDKLAPVPFEVTLAGPLADAIRKEAKRSGNKEETIIAEAVRSYLGEAR